MDRQMRTIDAAELFGAGMDMHERHLRPRNVEQRVALRRQFAHPPADQNDEVGGFDALDELRIRADAEIAGVARMQRIEQMQTAERRAHRQRVFLREARDAVRKLPATSGCRQESGSARARRRAAARTSPSRPRPATSRSRVNGGASSTATRSVNMSSGRLTTTGPGRPLAAVWNARDTISGTRAGSSISVAHLVIEPNTAR